MRNNKELADAVLRRAEELRLEKEKQKNRIYSALAVAVCLVIVVGFSVAMSNLMPDASAVSGAPGIYNATLLAGGMIGSYIIIGVVAFALGVCVTLLCLKLRRGK